MEIESLETIFNKYADKEYNQIGLYSSSSVNEDDLNHENQQKICQTHPIYKQPKTQTFYMLIGDSYIDLDPRGSARFIETIRLQNSYRPVQQIIKDIEKKFIRIQVDQSVQGVKDFRFLIYMMQTMQNQEMYELSKLLEDYQQIVDFWMNKFKEDTRKITNKQSLFKQQEQVIEQILKQEAINNPLAIQIYEVYNCVQGCIDARKAEFGYNENYVYFIGTDPETLQTFTMREGWFNSYTLIDSNKLEIKFFQEFIKQFFMNENISIYHKPIDHVLYTIDQILIPIKVQPTLYYIYDDMTKSTEIKPESISKLISCVCIYNIDIEASNIKKLMNIRKQKNTLATKNILLNSFDRTLSQFSYEISADYFFNKFYNTPKNELPKEPQLNEIFPEKTCKFRMI